MKISFCLPGMTRKPVGGFKIVFEYANRLAERGHKITIFFDGKEQFQNTSFPVFLQKMILFYLTHIHPFWFPLNKGIKKRCIYGITDKTIYENEFIVATAVQTAVPISRLNDKKGKKIYFVQGFENWVCTDEEVIRTYNLGLKNITISKWLKEIMDANTSTPTCYIPNGIDFEKFYIKSDIEFRDPFSISMLYHKSSHKGVVYGIEVLREIKEKYSSLIVKMFGVPDRPKDLPSWIEYTKNASEKELLEIYNTTAIYLCSTIDEGFGLTGAESMACGCALVSTSYAGVYEYAVHERNALLSNPKDVKQQVNNIEKLFSDQKYRMELARQGSIDIRDLDWNYSLTLFEKALKDSDGV